MEAWRQDLYRNELYHHGILGMKWGKRNGPPYPLGSGDHSASEKKAGWKKSLNGKNPDEYGNDRLKTKTKEVKNTVKDTVKKAGKVFIDSFEDVTAEQYEKTFGMTKSDAREAAKKKTDVMKKVAIGVGVGAAAVLTVYGVSYLRGKGWTDRVIKAGTTIQTLSADPNRLEQGKSFFTNFNDTDKKIYEGAFSRAVGGFKNAIQADVKNDIMVAGPKSGKKAFKELLKTDTKFKEDYKAFEEQFKGFGYIKGYDLFNAKALALDENQYYGKQVAYMQDKFYGLLKEKGYGGVIDINDLKYSNLRASSPTIIFDKTNLGEIRVQKVTREMYENGKQIAAKEIPKLHRINPNKKMVYTGAKSLAVLGISGGSMIYDAKVGGGQAIKNIKLATSALKKRKTKKK